MMAIHDNRNPTIYGVSVLIEDFKRIAVEQHISIPISVFHVAQEEFHAP